MMCFKDRTYCSKYIDKICINHNCTRSFTKEDREQAIDWWGGENFPLCISDMQTDSCGFISYNIEILGKD